MPVPTVLVSRIDSTHRLVSKVMHDIHELMASIRRDNEAISSRRGGVGGKPLSMVSTYVLVVEDDFDVRETVADILREDGHDVLTATNGVEALQILDHEYIESQRVGGVPRKPSVILLDLMMPAMNGIQFYVELRRSRPMFASVPVIVMSADTNVRDFDWVVSTSGIESAVDHINKPFGIDNLIDKVRKAIGE